MLDLIETGNLAGALTVSAGTLTTAFSGNRSFPIVTHALELSHYKDASATLGVGRCAIANELVLEFSKVQGLANDIQIQVTESDTEAFTIETVVPVNGAPHISVKSSTYDDSTVYRVGLVAIRGKYVRIAARYSGGAATTAAITIYFKLNHNEQLPSGSTAITGSSGLVADVRPTDLVVDEGLAYSASGTISGGTWVTDVITFTQTAHGYDAGAVVTVSGCGNTNYNGTFTVTGAPTADTWTCAKVGDPGAFTTAGSALQAQSTTHLVDENKAWTADEHSTAGRYVEIVSGTGARQYAAITDNGTTWLAFSALSTAPVTSDSSYSIIELGVNALVCNTELALKLGSITVNNIDAGKYRATQPDIAAGDSAQLNIDIKGNTTVAGAEAHDAAANRAPVLVGGYASGVAQTAVSAAADVSRVWVSLNGAVVTAGLYQHATPANAVSMTSPVVIDDAIMFTGATAVPVAGQYNATALTYTSKDACVLQCNINGALITTGGVGGGAPVYGVKTITVAGTEEALHADSAVTDGKSVCVKALHTNTGVLYVGANGLTSSTGFQLYPGEPVNLAVTNLNLIYLDVDVSGEGASFIIEG